MRHLLSAGDLDLAEATSILDLAEEMQQVQSRPVKKLPALRGRTIVNIFFEDSTRTRTSFEIAGKWLSADTINVSAKGSSVSKGESLRDTMMTLDAMGADAFVIRHSSSGAAAQVAGWVRAQVINAGDGQHEHPTQALLDAFSMRQHFLRDVYKRQPAIGFPSMFGRGGPDASRSGRPTEPLGRNHRDQGPSHAQVLTRSPAVNALLRRTVGVTSSDVSGRIQWGPVEMRSHVGDR